MTAVVRRRSRNSDDLWEPALDVAVAVVAVIELAALLRSGPDLPGTALVVLTAGAAAVRRRVPVIATLLAACAVPAAGVLERPLLTCAIAAQVGLFSVALRRAVPWIVSCAVAVGVLLSSGISLVAESGYTPLVVLPWTGLVVGAGLAVRSHRAYVAALEETARQTSSARESEIERRITEERLTIARDLHDAVGHSIAVISVHAGAAEQFLPANPDRAVASLHHVRSASRRVLTELKEILSVLRTGDDELAPTPPSSEGVPALISGARDLGLRVRASVAVDLNDLPPATDAALYRVLQEALTNAHRHGSGDVDIAVEWRDDWITMTVSNRTHGPGPAGAGGYGLIGMGERVTRAGGILSTRREPDRFILDVRLPAGGRTAELPSEGGPT